MPANNEEVIGGFGDGDNGGENSNTDSNADEGGDGDFPEDLLDIRDIIVIDDGEGDNINIPNTGGDVIMITNENEDGFSEEYKEQLRLQGFTDA